MHELAWKNLHADSNARMSTPAAAECSRFFEMFWKLAPE
jgi:hypothetical protein